MSIMERGRKSIPTTTSMLVSANKKSRPKIKSFQAYLEANFALTILKVTRAEVSTFECGANIDILVSEPSCAVGDGPDIDLLIFLLMLQLLALVGLRRRCNFKQLN